MKTSLYVSDLIPSGTTIRRLLVLLASASLPFVAQAATYTDAVLASNPVVYYQFQGTGTTVTDSGSAAINGTASSTATQGASGPSGAGFLPNNTGVTIVRNTTTADSFVSLSSASLRTALNGAAAVSVELWINPSTITVNQGLFNIPITASGTYAAGLGIDLWNANGDIRLSGRSQPGDTFQNQVFNAGITSSSWTHLVAIFNYANDTLTLYVNGVSLGSKSVNFGSETLNITAGTGSVVDTYLGRNGQSGAAANSYGGGIDEFALYNYALSAEDVLAHYTASTIPEPSTLGALIGGTAIAVAFVSRRRRA